MRVCVYAVRRRRDRTYCPARTGSWWSRSDSGCCRGLRGGEKRGKEGGSGETIVLVSKV